MSLYPPPQLQQLTHLHILHWKYLPQHQRAEFQLSSQTNFAEKILTFLRIEKFQQHFHSPQIYQNYLKKNLTEILKRASPPTPPNPHYQLQTNLRTIQIWTTHPPFLLDLLKNPPKIDD
ncbi:MAG: hypothetical protein D6805_08390 [Planctomycetota bacterium]|nr:MAG: hypothetical protein D6805_08390 [Planctomycetota bacterium]